MSCSVQKVDHTFDVCKNFFACIFHFSYEGIKERFREERTMFQTLNYRLDRDLGTSNDNEPTFLTLLEMPISLPIIFETRYKNGIPFQNVQTRLIEANV